VAVIVLGSGVRTLRSAAQKILAEQVIRKLPQGYHQVLGRRFEGGWTLPEAVATMPTNINTAA
jgi:hypothetical protein